MSTRSCCRTLMHTPLIMSPSMATSLEGAGKTQAQCSLYGSEISLCIYDQLHVYELQWDIHVLQSLISTRLSFLHHVHLHVYMHAPTCVYGVCLFRLQGEKRVYDLIKRVQAYLEPRFSESRPDILCSIYIRRIEHLYYKVHVQYMSIL